MTAARLRVSTLIVIASFGLIACAATRASEHASEADAVTELDVRPVSLACFKNGYGVLTLRGELPVEAAGRYRVSPLHDAGLGTLWLSWPAAWDIVDVRADEHEAVETRPAGSVADVLAANVGQTVTLTTADDEVTGVIRHAPEVGGPTPMERRSSSPRWIVPPPGVSDVVLIESEGSLLALPVHRVTAVELDAEAAATTVDETTTTAAVSFRVAGVDAAAARAGEPGGFELRMLVRDVLWSPSYRVTLGEEAADADHGKGTATLSAKAVVMNDLLDLDHTQVELITGFPHLAFAGIDSAMNAQSVQQFVEQLNEQARRESQGQAMVMSNVVMQQARGVNAGGGSGYAAGPVAGQRAEDLFFYPLGEVTLDEGVRGYFPLFRTEVPYRHLYTWDAAPADHDRRSRSDGEEDREVVWHNLELTNDTDVPWTTAPSETVAEGRLVGQDTLHFTPPGADTLLKITRALTVRAEQTEREVERDRNAATFHGTTYDRITVEGTLRVVNGKDRPITLRLTKSFEGELVEADAEPAVTRETAGLRSVNPQTRLEWERTIEPGADEALELTYRYRFYAR